MNASSLFDADHLHQEAILIARKADIREELDRLAAHISAAAQPCRQGAIDRALGTPGMNRETNALCSKSNDIEDCDNIRLELKSVVEQFREQVQNLE